MLGAGCGPSSSLAIAPVRTQFCCAAEGLKATALPSGPVGGQPVRGTFCGAGPPFPTLVPCPCGLGNANRTNLSRCCLPDSWPRTLPGDSRPDGTGQAVLAPRTWPLASSAAVARRQDDHHKHLLLRSAGRLPLRVRTRQHDSPARSSHCADRDVQAAHERLAPYSFSVACKLADAYPGPASQRRLSA